MRVVAYSAVMGGRDAFRPSDYPMTLFTDDWPDRASEGNVDVLPPMVDLAGPGSPVRRARWHSANAHLACPDADFSVWVSGSHRLAASPEALVDLLGDADFGCQRHALRDCAYQEGYEVAALGLDDPEVLRRQLARYRSAGHPEHWGLWGLSVYVRRHSEKVERFNEEWWWEVVHGSYRDQVSFPVAARRHGLKVADMPGDQYESPLFTVARHPYAPRRFRGANIRPAHLAGGGSWR